MATDPIVILSTARTPMGAMQGALADASATDLGATAVRAAVERSGARSNASAPRATWRRHQAAFCAILKAEAGTELNWHP